MKDFSSPKHKIQQLQWKSVASNIATCKGEVAGNDLLHRPSQQE